jgi:hypothetical protein
MQWCAVVDARGVIEPAAERGEMGMVNDEPAP